MSKKRPLKLKKMAFIAKLNINSRFFFPCDFYF